MKKIKTLAAAAVVAVSLFSMQGDAMAAEANTISVRGIAKQEVAPDMAYLTLGISVKGDTAESGAHSGGRSKSESTSGFVRDGDQ